MVNLNVRVNNVRVDVGELSSVRNFVYVISAIGQQRCKFGSSRAMKGSNRLLQYIPWNMFEDIQADIFTVSPSSGISVDKWEVFILCSLNRYFLVGEALQLQHDIACGLIRDLLSGQCKKAIKYGYGRRYSISINGEVSYDIPRSGKYLLVASSEVMDRCIVGITDKPFAIFQTIIINNPSHWICTDYWKCNNMNMIMEIIRDKLPSPLSHVNGDSIIVRRSRDWVNKLIIGSITKIWRCPYQHMVQQSGLEGYIYLAHTHEIPDVIKIGSSCKIPSLSCSLWKQGEVKAYKVNNYKVWEKYIQMYLINCWQHNEVFALKLEDAESIVSQLVKGKCYRAKKLTGGSSNYISIDGITSLTFPDYREQGYIIVFHSSAPSRCHIQVVYSNYSSNFKRWNLHKEAFFHYFSFHGDANRIIKMAVSNAGGEWVSGLKNKVNCDIIALLNNILVLSK